MSTRYGISVILDPAFSAGLHRARQVICSQYGCWAAEMHSVHLPLAGYFACPEQEVPSLGAALEKVAGDFRGECPEAYAVRGDIVLEPEKKGCIYLAFGGGCDSVAEGEAGTLLRAEVAEVLGRFNLAVGTEAAPLRFALLQYSGLSAQVFQSAARFAAGVVEGLQLPTRGSMSELVLFRFESTAAGECWGSGAWATDLSWRIMGSYPLETGRYPHE